MAPIIARVASEIGDPKPPHWKTVSGWHTLMERVDFATKLPLCPRYSERGTVGPRLPIVVTNIVFDAINQIFLTTQQHDCRSIYDAVVAEIGRRNLSLPPEDHLNPPHRSTIYRWIRSIDGITRKRFRESKRAAALAYSPVGQGPRADEPNAVWEIDHCKIDLIVVTNDGIPIGRPWLTMVLDRYSRAIIGYYLTFDPPSAHSVMACLRHAIMPKVGTLERYPNLKIDYPFYGLPKVVVVDNGLEFHSASFVSAMHDLGIHIEYAPAFRPQWKGRIERSFGTIARRLFHQIPGTTRSNVRKRGDKNPVADACLTYAEIEGTLLDFITNDYSVSPHKGIGNTPKSAYLDSGFRPLLPSSVRDLDILLLCETTRVARHDGISLHRLQYNSTDISRIRSANNGSIRLKVKFDPTELGHIFVQDPKSGLYISIPAVDQEYAKGLSLAQHKTILRESDQDLRKKVDAKKLCTTRDNIRRRMNSFIQTPRLRPSMMKERFNSLSHGGGTMGEITRLVSATPDERTNFNKIIEEADNTEPSSSADTSGFTYHVLGSEKRSHPSHSPQPRSATTTSITEAANIAPKKRGKSRSGPKKGRVGELNRDNEKAAGEPTEASSGGLQGTLPDVSDDELEALFGQSTERFSGKM